MSISEMSNTVKNEILRRLRDSMENKLKQTAEFKGSISARNYASFIEYTSRNQIRKETDTAKGGHESIMSRQAFTELFSDMSHAISQNQLSQKLTALVNNAGAFELFLKYLGKQYFNDEDALISGPATEPPEGETDSDITYTGQRRARGLIFAQPRDRAEAYRDVLIFKNMPQDKFVGEFVKFIKSVATDLTTDELAELKKSLQGGHLTGVFTARLVRAFNLTRTGREIGFKPEVMAAAATNTPRTRTDLEQQLERIVNLVTDADYLSSNIVYDIDLFMATDKRLYPTDGEIELTTEAQFAAANKAAGDLLVNAGIALTKLINSIAIDATEEGKSKVAADAFESLIESLSNLSEYIKVRVQNIRARLALAENVSPEAKKKIEDHLVTVLSNQQTIETLLTTKGSDSLLDHLANVLVSQANGTRVNTSVSKVNVGSNLKKSRNLSKPIKITAKKTPRAKPVKIVAGASGTRIRTKMGQFYSLASLQQLIDSLLVQTIKKNMGDGNKRDILNLRTGRLAESVKIERMSESREGMITAFYTYMKNPYATFSQGGRQELPRSRDPKLLIAKSIREIAAQKVAYRLRAVAL